MQDSVVNKPDLYNSKILQILHFYLNKSEVILNNNHKIRIWIICINISLNENERQFANLTINSYYLL